MGERLDDDAIAEALKGSDWEHGNGEMVREWEFGNFQEAWAFACEVAAAAEEANHHPDILAHGWNKVRITLSTHSAGGLTGQDLALAKTIDELRP